MRILTFSSLYPNAARPDHGIFVEQRLRHLIATTEIVSKVVAPVPWFPFGSSLFGKYAAFARAPAMEVRHGIEVTYPRYPLIPKFGMLAAPLMMAAAMRPIISGLLRSGYDFDLIDAHYFYPDGVAAVKLGQWFNKPVVITARGTDINLIPGYKLPRRMIVWAASHCAAVITVCQALKDALVDLGVAEHRITTLRNGVDLDLFRPAYRQAARARLQITGTTLLSVGHLVERKGHHIAIEAMKDLPDIRLIVAGDGEMKDELVRFAASLGVAGRVTFAGAVPHEDLPCYYNAADALVLASSREGMANVLLESLACGTPVIATRSWGTPEVVASSHAGVLMEARTPQSLATAVKHLLGAYPNRTETRRYAERFGWQDTSRGQLALFERVLAARGTASMNDRLQDQCS
ncbi:MAG: glycosyltransferase family 4 protein [Gammaproteobacteria bacterium]